MLAIWNDLAPLIGESPVLTPAIDATLASAVIAATTPTAPGVGIASGGLDVTRRDMLGVIQGGRLGERQREINETLDHFDQLARLFPVVQGDEALRRIVLGGLVVETCGLLELVYEVPAGRAPKDYYLPLLDLVDASSPAGTGLANGSSALDATAVAEVQEVRNAIAAHVDPVRPLGDLLRLLDGLDPADRFAASDARPSALRLS